MYERQTRAGDLGVTRLLGTFAALAVAFVVTLAIAPAKSLFTEWRATQTRYNALAVAQNVTPRKLAIEQIWQPALGVVDRCPTCHLGTAGGQPLAGDMLFSAHPSIPHDPLELGCTTCHGGQGRATRRDAGHGRVRFWESPMLEPFYYQAGCGACHTHLPVASPALAERGRDLFQRHDCLACHRVGAQGRGTGPDLSYAGTRGVPDTWHERHLTLRASRAEPEWRQSYGELSLEDQLAIQEYLRTLQGAPRLLAAKTLAHQLGCRGCHKINGIGGDEGPDLTRVGLKSEHTLDFTHVEGPHTLSTWLEEHFLAPDRVVPGSKMPSPGVTKEEADLLTLYMLSLRPLDAPQEHWPKDRVLGVRFGRRDFPRDGEGLYGVFCSACHGPRGAGRRVPGLGLVPAIGHRDFLAIADDELIRASISRGRPGRRMPAWGVKDGGLTREEIDAIVGYLRGLEPGTPEPWDQTLPAGEPHRGQRTYSRDCSGCHGLAGEGNVGPQLSNPELHAAATDEFLARTILRGRTASGMRHFGEASVSFEALTLADAADLVAYLRTLNTANRPKRPEGARP